MALRLAQEVWNGTTGGSWSPAGTQPMVTPCLRVSIFSFEKNAKKSLHGFFSRFTVIDEKNVNPNKSSESGTKIAGRALQCLERERGSNRFNITYSLRGLRDGRPNLPSCLLWLPLDSAPLIFDLFSHLSSCLCHLSLSAFLP